MGFSRRRCFATLNRRTAPISPATSTASGRRASTLPPARWATGSPSASAWPWPGAWTAGATGSSSSSGTGNATKAPSGRPRCTPATALDNLIAVWDYNGLQIDGITEDIPLEPLADKWRAFGWDVVEIDGHDWADIYSTLNKAKAAPGKPVMIIAHTIKAKGSAKGDQPESHNIKVDDEAGVSSSSIGEWLKCTITVCRTSASNEGRECRPWNFQL